jgi:hypothetical protein
MAKVKLEFETDLLPLETALQQGESLISKARSEVVLLGKDSKSAFSVAANETDKFSKQIVDTTTDIKTLHKVVQASQDLLKQGGKITTYEDQQRAIQAVKAQLADMIDFEKKLIEQQSKIGPANIRQQFSDDIDVARKQVERLSKDLHDLQNLTIAPVIRPQVERQTPGEPAQQKPLAGAPPTPKIPGTPGSLLPPIPPDYTQKIRQITQEIKRLTGEALAAGHGTEIFTENLRKAGELKNELTSVRAAVESVAGSTTRNLGKALTESTELGVKGFEGLIAVQALFGTENKDVERQILKLQAVQSIGRLVSEFGGLKDKLTEIKLAFTPLTNLYTRGNEALKTFGKTGKDSTEGVAKSSKNLFTTFGTGVKSLATNGINAFKSLWATIAANPLGVVLVVIGGVIAAMVALKDKIKPIAALFEFLGNVVDALLLPFERLGQAFGIVASQQEKATKMMIENTKKQEESVASFFDSEIALAEASEKRTAELERRKVRELEETVKARLQALQWLHKQNGKLTEDELKEYEDSQKRLLELSRESSVLLAKEQTDRRKFAQAQQSNIDDLKIASIKDDETREKAALKKKFDDDILAAAERTVGVFGTEKEQYSKALPEFQAIEKKFQSDLAAVRAKYAKQRLEKLKQDNDKLLALQKDFADQLASIMAKLEQGRASNLFGEERLAFEREQGLKEVEILRQTLIKKGQAEEDFEAQMQKRKPQVFKLDTQQEAAFTELRQQVYEKETEDLIKLTVERENKIAQAKTQAAKQTSENLDTQEANIIANVELAAPPKIDPNAFAFDKQQAEIAFEKKKQQAILDIQAEYAQKRFDLATQAREAERAEQVKALDGELALLQDRNDEDAKLRRDQIIESLNLLEQKFAGERIKSQDEFAKIVNDIQAKREELNKAPKFDLMKFLGLTPEIVNGLRTMLGEVQKALEQSINTNLEKVNSEISESKQRQASAESDIATLENKLAAEQDLGERGKANNAGRIQADIDAKQQAANKEKEIQKQLLEEQKKVQKQKLLLDSISQASNLITASTNILANTARDPVSLAIALAAVATMITSFIALKAQAVKAINTGGPQGFAKGVIDLQGPGTGTSDSISAKLSRGESVMTAKETREHKKLFQGIRANDNAKIREGIFNLMVKKNIRDVWNKKEPRRSTDKQNSRAAIRESMRATRRAMHSMVSPMISEAIAKATLAGPGVPVLPPQLPAQLAAQRDTVSRNEFNTFVNNDFSTLENGQAQTNAKLDALIYEQRQSAYKDQNDNLIIKKGSHTIIRKKNG